jgi:hypothetical protein
VRVAEFSHVIRTCNVFEKLVNIQFLYIISELYVRCGTVITFHKSAIDDISQTVHSHVMHTVTQKYALLHTSRSLYISRTEIVHAAEALRTWRGRRNKWTYWCRFQGCTLRNLEMVGSHKAGERHTKGLKNMRSNKVRPVGIIKVHTLEGALSTSYRQFQVATVPGFSIFSTFCLIFKCSLLMILNALHNPVMT